MNFHIQDEEIERDTHVIELGGEVDLYTAPEFKERMVELIEGGKKQIVVDLSKATFIDSTTLGVLVGGVKRLRPRAARSRWSAPTRTSRRSSRSPASTASSRSTPRATRRSPSLGHAAELGAPRTIVGRSPAARSGPLAQLVEQETLNLKVEGSIPSRPIANPAGLVVGADRVGGHGAQHVVVPFRPRPPLTVTVLSAASGRDVVEH